MKIGILAYGSLIDNPGKELEKIIEKKIEDIETPFKIEFARSSSTRGGAPTLVPYKKGAKIRGIILLLKEDVSIEEARNILYRREIDKVGGLKINYDIKNNLSLENVYDNSTKSICKIIEIDNFELIDKVLSTSFSANIENLSAKKLSKLAIESYENKKVKKGKDGITYLENAKEAGIRTPLMDEYEREINLLKII